VKDKVNYTIQMPGGDRNNVKYMVQAVELRNVPEGATPTTLPPGWHKGQQMDGKVYYYSDLGTRQWDFPTNAAVLPTAAASQGSEGSGTKPALPRGWHEGTLADGKIYYWSDGGGRQWEKPDMSQTEGKDRVDGGATTAAQGQKQPPVLPSGWHEGHAADGALYFWSDNGTQQWHRPTQALPKVGAVGLGLPPMPLGGNGNPIPGAASVVAPGGLPHSGDIPQPSVGLPAAMGGVTPGGTSVGLGLPPMPVVSPPVVAPPTNPIVTPIDPSKPPPVYRPPEGPMLPQGWHESRTTEGKVYFWSDSGERQWDRPSVPLFKPVAPKPQSPINYGTIDDDLDDILNG